MVYFYCFLSTLVCSCLWKIFYNFVLSWELLAIFHGCLHAPYVFGHHPPYLRFWVNHFHVVLDSVFNPFFCPPAAFLLHLSKLFSLCKQYHCNACLLEDFLEFFLFVMIRFH